MTRWILIFAGCTLLGQTPAGSVVEGLAVNGATGEPLSKVRVLLRAQNNRQDSYLEQSGSDGRFSIDGVAPGVYRVTAERPGFQFDAGGASGAPPPTAIVKAGEDLRGFAVKMMPLGVITGRVIDAAGDPVPNSQIEIQRYAIVQGRRQLTQAASAITNRLGEFRAFDLEPGNYYLRALPSRARGPFLLPDPATEAKTSGDIATYFPNAVTTADARAVEVGAGTILRGFEVRLRRERLFSLRGTLPTKAPESGGYSLMIVPRDQPQDRSHNLRMTGSAFEFAGLAPGSYVLNGFVTADGKRQYSRQSIDIIDSDVENVTLSFAPGAEIPGVVRVEGGTAPLPPGLRINSIPEGPTMSGFSPVEVAADGSFAFHDLGPGVYQVVLAGSTPGLYFKALRSNGEVQPGQRFDSVKTQGPLVVALGADAGTIEGIVKNADGNAAKRVRVTLVPMGDHAGRVDLSRFAFTGEDGTFRMQDVPPGEWRLYAWENVERGPPQSAEYRKPFEKHGVTVKLAPSATAKVELDVITVAEMKAAGR
jgi:hypothetical protein